MNTTQNANCRKTSDDSILHFKKETKTRSLHLCIQICTSTYGLAKSTSSKWGQILSLGAAGFKGKEGTTSLYIFVLLDYFTAKKSYFGNKKEM